MDTAQLATMQDGDLMRLGGILALTLHELVDDPEPLKLEAVEENGRVTFQIFVPAHEYGKVIGMHGRTARALRVIMTAAGAKYKRSFLLDIRQLEGEAA